MSLRGMRPYAWWILGDVVRRPGQRLVGAHVFQPALDNRRDRGEGVAAGDEQLRQGRHPGEFHERVAQLGRITLLRATPGGLHGLQPVRY
jgi:hypothetical protein